MKRASKCDACDAAGSIEVPSSDDAMRSTTPPRPHSSQQGFSVPPGLATIQHRDAGMFAALTMIVMRVALAALRN